MNASVLTPNKLSAQVSSKPMTAIYAAAIASLVMLTVLKNDAAAFANTEFWSEYSNSTLTAALKRSAWGLAGVAVSLIALSFFKIGKIWILSSLAVFLLLLAYFIGVLRGLVGDPAFSLKMALGFAILLTFHTLFSSLQRKYGGFWDVVDRGLRIAAYLIIALNLFDLFSGNGFVPGNPRFFGIGGHPNFTGVQMAVCVLVLLPGLWSKNVLLRMPLAAFLLLAVYLLFLTGSRTGLLILAAGLVALASTMKLGYSSLLIILSALVIGLLVLAASGLNFTSFTSVEVYNRGGANTRSAAWTSMWALVYENPIFGNGDFVGNSENSLLRGWVAIGIMYPILLIGAIGSLVAQIMKLGVSKFGRRFPTLLAVPSGLLCGSILEGYLIDSFTFPMVMWCICLSAISVLAKSPDRKSDRQCLK